MKKSLWQNYKIKSKFKVLDVNKKTDIVIIGGGITGLSTAYNLKDSKYKIIIVDAKDFISSTTCKSTAKITYLQDLKYSYIQSIYDFNTSKLYYESQKDAIKLIKKIINDNLIECDLKKTSMITFTCSKEDLNKFKTEKEILKKLDVNYDDSLSLVDIENIKDLIMVKNNYTFNPAKYINGLLEILKEYDNIDIYKKSMVTKIKKEDNGYILYVNNSRIEAKKIVVACSYPFFSLPGFIPLKTYLEKSYLCATEVSDVNKYAYISTNKPIISLRYYEDNKNKYVIYLRGASKISENLNSKKNYDNCIFNSKKILKKTPSYVWTNMDVMTNDHLPLIGKISKTDKNVFIATGYNTWGMTNGTIAGKIISNLILGKKSKYFSLFSPTRNLNIKKNINFLKNTLYTAIKSYSFTLIRKNPSWYKDKTYITKKDGKRVGIHIDSNGNKHMVLNTCPHLKCHLLYNEVDKTWDCPCHGSRFDIDGNIVKGPSVYNIKYK